MSAVTNIHGHLSCIPGFQCSCQQESRRSPSGKEDNSWGIQFSSMLLCACMRACVLVLCVCVCVCVRERERERESMEDWIEGI